MCLYILKSKLKPDSPLRRGNTPCLGGFDFYFNIYKCIRWAILYLYYSSYFLNIMVLLWPPKPSEFDIATFISWFRGSFGIMSRSHSSSFSL